MIGGKRCSVYRGIALTPLKPLSSHDLTGDTYDPLKIVDLVSDHFVMKSSDANKISFTYDTNYYSNGSQIAKCVTFYANKTWSLTICGHETHLEIFEVDKRFDVSKESIELVCKQVVMLKLCEGITVTKSIVCSRYHTLECLIIPGSASPVRKLRSLLCCRVVSLISDTNTCRYCQQMTFGQNNTIIDKTTSEQGSQEEPAPCDNQTKKASKEDFKKIIPDASESMLELLMSQAVNTGRKSTGRRWSSNMISVCLQLYSRSPNAYKTLQASKMLVLPSISLLVLYKNSIKHEIGFQEEVFHWMFKEARRLDLPASGLIGGIILDEMAIQADLQISKAGDVVELIGFEDLGKEGNMYQTLRKGNHEPTLGTHVLQFVFLGVGGFRFPFAHFISTQVQAPEINSLFWEAVDNLQMFGFTTVFTCMDGAQCNRSFLHINLGKESDTMCAKNPCNFEEPVIFMMDYSHVMKKVRNNIMKSGIKTECTRNLTLPNGNIIQWQMWVDCSKWDESNGLQVHRKLTKEHIYPSTQSKMRNHLAEEVLNEDMLDLFITYQSHLGNKGSVLDGPIQLLKRTSKMIEIFRDHRPIKDLSDKRLTELREVFDWFKEWQYEVENDSNLSSKEKSQKLMSRQCTEDVKSCLMGFIQLCDRMLTRSPKADITPALINSDIVENTFNQQRSTFNGANSNPNALQYRKTLNSIILGQNIISHKSNAGKIKNPAAAYTLQSQRTGKPGTKRKSVRDNKENKPIKVIRF